MVKGKNHQKSDRCPLPSLLGHIYQFCAYTKAFWPAFDLPGEISLEWVIAPLLADQAHYRKFNRLVWIIVGNAFRRRFIF